MQNNKIMKFLIPVIAVIIIIESVILVNNLSKKNKVVEPIKVEENSSASQSATPQIVEEPALDLVFATDTKEMKIGKTYSVELNMLSKEDNSLSVMNFYIKYDPTLLTASSLTVDSKLPKATFNKIGEQTGIVAASILVDAKDGYKINKDKNVPVLRFNVTPKKVGAFKLEIASSNDSKDFVTLFTDNATRKVLPFSSNELNINISK